MNTKYKNLYQELVSREMTDLDENSFYNEYSQNDNKFLELYSYLDSNELTDLDPETFKLEYFGTPIIKKKSQVESTESNLEDGLSERLSTTTTRPLESSIYILPSNPGALYRKKGDSWLKKIGENYIPLSKGDVRARERILDKQAVLASDFQADWYSNQPKEIPESEYATQEQVNKAYPDLPKERWKGATVTPIDQTIPTEKTRAFEQEEAKDSILPEEKIEPATYKEKLYMLQEGKDNKNFYKNPVTEETYLYWLDNNGKPREGLDPIKSQEAVDLAANIIGESQMNQLSKINKIDKIDLNKRDVDKFLKKELYGSNFGFNQEGNELTINSYFPGMNGDDEGLENSITIDLSKSNSSSIAKEFLRYNLFTKREKEVLENIKDTESYIDAMINSNGKIKMTSDRVDVISEWARTEAMAIENDIKRNEVDVIDKDIKSYEEKTKLFKKRVASGNMTQQEFDKENDDLSKLYKDISIKQKRAQELSNRAQKLISAEELIQTKGTPEEKGNTIGALVKSFTSGMSNLALTGLDYSLAAGNLIMGDEKFSKLIDGNYGAKKAKGLTDAQIANAAQATVKDFAKEKYDLGWENITGTNKEYIRSKNRGMIPQALNAVAESFGTAATGGALGKVGSTAAFFSMSYNAMEDQMRGPDFDHLSENEKKLISVPYGLVIGQMEKWGFDVAVGAGKNPLFNKFANYIVTKTFKNLPKNAGLIELNSAIQKNIGASIAKGLIKITGAGVSEGNVEFMQQEFEGIQKFAVNEILKNDNFKEEYFKDAPDLSKAGGWSELMGQGVDAFKLGFLAGGMTSSGASVKDNIVDIGSNNKFDIYKNLVLNTESRNGWIASIKEDQKNEKISPEEMNKKIDEINRSYSTLIKIPASLTTQSQREAFSLLQERENIENEIKDKEPNLVVKETNRIKEINEALKTTSENATKEDNIKQQEVTAEGGVSEYQGTSEGQPEVGQVEGGQREATVNETDSRNSTIPSQVQKEELDAVNDRIVKIEAAEKKGELLEDTVPGELKKLKDRKRELELTPQVETTGEVVIDKPVITTNITAEVQRVKSLTPESEDGATFNIDGTKYEGVGLVVPVDSMNTTTEELTPEMVADFVAERQKMIGDAGVVKAGIYKFPNSNQVSIDLSVVVPETSREQALEFARLAGQESLFDLATFENIKTGETGENPMKFNPEQHREISKALKEGRMPNVFGTTVETTKNLLTKENVNEVASKQTTPKNKLIVKAAKMVLNAIPGVKIYIHNNGQEMASAIESSKRKLTKEEKTGLTESNGLYVDGNIHINLESATIGTVYHEAFHALIEKNGMKSGSILLMAKGLKNIISDKGIKQRLDDFVSQYNEDEKAEEYMSELGGILSEAEQELTTTKLQQFKTLINNIAKKLGLPVIFSASATAQDAADFINTMSKKLRTGEEIEVGEVKGKTGIKAQVVTIMKGEESMEKYGLKKGKNVTRKIGEALESRQRAKYGKIDQKDNSPEARKKISNWMVDEVKYFIDLMGDKSGKGWYGELYQKSLDAMGKVFPEMKTDQNARDLFTMLVAITSDGQKVMSNFKLAAFAYDYYKKNGSMPKTLPGQRVASFEANLKRINDLLNQYDGDIATIKKDLMEVKSIEEINKERKKEGLEPLSTNWPVSFKTPFAASVFGAKLGMFYSNLSGNEAYPTLDRWWSRTFNRYRGTLIPALKGGFDKKGEALGLDRFKKILGNPDMSNEEALLASKSYRDSYAAKGYKNGTEIEKAANTIYKIVFENLNDAPFTKNDRQFMYDTISDAVNKLNKQGYDLSIADVQAILWYFEKNLYKTLGVQAKIEGISYEDAANYTYNKWLNSGKKFDYNIKETDESQSVEDEDINDVELSNAKKIKAQRTAPNGKPSNLNEKQWEQVRTPAFKKWFGDWENDSENASKVVDENGEPRAVFHGTNVEFDEFKKEALGSKNWMAESAYMGFFFAGDRSTSEAYTGMNSLDMIGISLGGYDHITNKYSKKLEKLQSDINNVWSKVYEEELNRIREKESTLFDALEKGLKEAGFNEKEVQSTINSVIKTDNRFRPNMDEVNDLANKENEINRNTEKLKSINEKMFSEIEKEWAKKTNAKPQIMQLFLNIRNPKIVDYKNIEKDASRLPDNISEAIGNKNDGVIFNNLRDGAKEDDIFVAFEPNQIKSATENVGTFSANTSKIKFQKNKTDKFTAPVAGNKLFNEPLKQALDIAKSYMKSIGKEYIPVEKITKLDEGLSKRISDAYDQMKDDPTDPEVKAAYEAMAKETLDQYDAITAKGYKVEINNNEPYSSSEDMINDLRDNNRMKIFSTESGFGEEPITEKQREENILLKDSGRKDANGETLLVNDVFRFVHDFFGHAKLGNSFGPIGEENAWRVHSEMYSPEAKKAMTSETRGQNSWVNFSGVNDAAFKKREKARQLRKEGKIDQANQMVGEVYDEMKFADQKIGLLPSFAVEEGTPSKIKKQLTQNWVATPVKSMKDSPIAKNSDNLRSVAIDLAKGKINQGEYADAVKKYSPIGSIGTLFAPSTLSHMITALGKKADKLMAPVVDELGKKIKRVGLRLDIPSYLHHNAWIVTVHDGRVKDGNVISYRNAARLKNVEFTTDPRVALNIAAGFNTKTTFARMVGEMVDIPGETAEEQGLNGQAMVEEIMNDPSWVQVGMNPFRHSFFWNRANGAPVVSADEVIQVGGLVYAKNVIEASPNSDRFTVYGKYDEAKNKVVTSEGPLLDKSGSKIKFQKSAQERRMDDEAEAIFKKSLDRGVSWNVAVQNVIDYIQISKWYENASDIDREQKIRDFRKSKKQKLKKAPSVAKILGKPKAKKVVTKDEYKAMITQIKLEAKAAREAKADLNAKRKMLATAIKGLVKLGKLTARQAGIIIERVGYVNLNNQVMVDRLADYAARVFEKADYQERLSRAFSFRKGIRELLKGDIQAEVVGMAKKFSKIDPSMVDDIEKYLEMAEIVNNAIKPSRVNRKDLDVNMRESMNIDSVSEFTNDAIENQERILKEELLAVHSELVDAGVIDDKMSLSDIESIISSLKEKADNADYEGDILTFLSRRIDSMSGIIKDILIFKINPMTGEDVALTEKNIDLISRMLNIDINNVSIKEAIFIAEAMDNFINNNITSSVEAVIEKNEGATELENLIADKVVASPLRKYFINKLGQFMSEQIASMPILFEKLFVGAKKGLMVAKKMGWTALINGVNKAEKMFNTTVDVYFKQYSKTKPNGKSFNDAENVYERGMLAFLSRNVSGTVTQRAEELKRRVEVLKESVKSLLKGSSREQKMGELYQKIYDKLNVESGDIDIISANVDKINRSAVNWWINQWGTTYNDLSDISLSIYNTMLSSDTSYTTDRYKLLDKVKLEEIIEPKNIGAFGRDIEFLDKNKTGVLMESTRPSASKVLKANRYVSLDFDVNNTSAYKGALIDINTAAAIRRIDGFINSDNLAKLIPTKEDRDIFTGRIKDYIQAAKNKRLGPSDTSDYLDQLTNFLGGIGVGKALGGIDQIVKQTLPIALSTFTNSGRLNILTPASNAWIDSLGMAISNRGQESQSTIESIDRRLDKANSGAKVVSNFIVDAQQIWLKWCLSKPDVFIAKSSFLSYYKQYLSNNNQSTDIDWATHNVNQDAADYAMLMVDRQQNVSDAKMAGKAFSSQNPITKVMRKIWLPFASFSLNQKSRMVSDIKVLGINSGASKQDRVIAARSLLSLPLEMLFYQSIGLAIRLGYLAIAKGIIGAVADDDDEEKEKLLGMEISKEMKNATKYPLRSMVTDFLSPIAIADHAVVGGANYLLSLLSVDQDMIDEAVSKKNLMLEALGKEKMNDKEKQDFIEKYKQDHEYQLFNDEKKSYGTLGIGSDTYKALIDNMNTAYTGKYTQDYMGNKSERYLLPKDQDNIKNAVIFEALFALGIVPRDVNTVTNNIIKLSKKNSLTEKQYEKYKDIKKEAGDITGWKMDLVKSKSKTESTLEELEWIKEHGGLTEKQGKEYVKLSSVVDEVSFAELKKIQSNMTADKIIDSYRKK